jgi:alanyl-tRNA synthetase
MDDVDAKTLRQVATTVQQKLGGDGVVVLGSAPAGNAVLIVLAGASAQAAGVHAGKLVGALAKQLGGGGGGRPDQAQAGGRNGSALPATIASAPKLIAEAVSTA